MEYFYNLLFYFAIYSFAGWCGEVVFATVRHGKFVNRGMLHGAYCPIYGFGLITVMSALHRLKIHGCCFLSALPFLRPCLNL